MIELMIVVFILGFLAVSVGVYMKSEKTKLKTFVYNTKTRFNQARFEAVKRGRNVFLDFDFDNDGHVDNGFTIWLDNEDDGSAPYDGTMAWSNADPYVDADANGKCDPGEGDCNGNGACDAGEGDCIIQTVTFTNMLSGSGKQGPEIYDGGAAYPTGGPEDDGPGTSNIGHGVSASADLFIFMPDGDSKAGSAYFYFPEGGSGGKKVAAGPWAIIVNTVGRIRIDEWRSSSSSWAVNENP